MKKTPPASEKTILEHIPDFLNHYKNNDYSAKTHENYKRYLNRFILWLKENKKELLIPSELTEEDALNYKSYLFQFRDQKGNPLTAKTQNFYLIALRALLRYFELKNINSLSPSKVILPRYEEKEKEVSLLNLEQINKLILMPDTKKEKGLRDRALLETIIFTGLKVNQLTNLNRDIKNLPQQNVYISKEALPEVEKYLQQRKDGEEALFVNYRAKKGSVGGRLNRRSMERIVNYYGKKLGLPFLTPENLRWAHVLALLNEEAKPKEIQSPKTHEVISVDKYGVTKETKKSLLQKDKSPAPWHIVETIINEEINWLKNIISVLPKNYKDNPPFLNCDDCVLRKIATLIISGKVGASEFKTKGGKSLWDLPHPEEKSSKKIKKHGQEWHHETMEKISRFFEQQKYKVVREPIINWGRADLGVYLNSKEEMIYIEVGTVSLFKLWYNFSSMKNSTFLVVPSEEYTLEFKV